DQYLWDGSGEPDPQVQRLETSLAVFRHRGETPAFLISVPSVETKPFFPFLQQLWTRRLGAIVAMAAAAVAISFLPVRSVPPIQPRPGWNVARIEGTPLVGANKIQVAGATAKLEVGELLVTNSTSSATITVAEIGEIQVDPGTRVRLLQTMRDRKRISLEEGTIHAAIWAPPGEFVVDTPSATAVDLGCAYTLHVAPDGSGLLRTTLGWVGFHANGHDSFIPAGAACPTHRERGPGTPYFEDATGSFRAALAKLDFDNLSPEARTEALRIVLSQARKDDALSLWHLLSRTHGADREKVFKRFAVLVPPPSGVNRDGILQLDQHQMDLWWNALGLGDISIWRFWEQTPGGSISANGQLLQKKQAILKQSR
ncbi:MAG TPA: FecR domain-containing protein, partial [Candidatus Acidoferrum sp.]|nr:FecR domain-containing protein [Candidatus Acidoferrum sp.]